MPTYQYRCPSCGYEFEEFQSMSEEPIQTCPSCGQHTKRVISGGAGFIFKGTGFYITDYKRKESRSSESSESSSKRESKSETKSDSKSTDTKSKASTVA